MAIRKQRTVLEYDGSYVAVPDPTVLTTEALNREIASLRTLLETRIGISEKSLEDVEHELREFAKPNVMSYISGAGLVITIVASLWVAGISPIKDRLEHLDAQEVRHLVGIEKINDILKERNQLFVTKIQFDEYKHHVEKKMDRIDTEDLTKDEWNTWFAERENTITNIIKRLDSLDARHQKEKDIP